MFLEFIGILLIFFIVVARDCLRRVCKMTILYGVGHGGCVLILYYTQEDELSKYQMNDEISCRVRLMERQN